MIQAVLFSWNELTVCLVCAAVTIGLLFLREHWADLIEQRRIERKAAEQPPMPRPPLLPPTSKRVYHEETMSLPVVKPK